MLNIDSSAMKASDKEEKQEDGKMPVMSCCELF